MKRQIIALTLAALTLTGGAAQAQSSGILSGAFVHFGYNGNDEVVPVATLPALFDELRGLGNDTVITTQTRATKAGEGCAYYPDQFEWVKGFPDKLGVILDAAHARGMTVYVGTQFSTAECGQFWQSSNTHGIEADIAANLSTLTTRYGSHPAFAGWYIPDEPGPPGPDKYDYYRRITAALKALAPGKKVTVAPYFAHQSQTPASLGQTALAFARNTGIDVQIWQDGIGASAQAKLFSWSRAGHSTEDYFQALGAALGPGGLWADVELFNYGDPLFNNSGGYRSASATRINQQLWSTRAAGKRVSWLHQWHMSQVIGPGAGFPEAPAQKALYRGIYGIGGAHALHPSSYHWDTPPSATYPDANELFNAYTADPRNPSDAGWIGLHPDNGTAQVSIDLGSAQKVDWIGLHTLSTPGWGIRAPLSAQVYCALVHGQNTLIASLNRPFAGAANEEYLLANTAALNQTCRYLVVTLPTNGNWLFLSEIELSAD